MLDSPEIVASILSSEGVQYGYQPWTPHSEPRLGQYLTPVFYTEKYHHPSSKFLPNRDLQKIISPHFPDIDFTKEFVGITEPTPESVYRDINKFNLRYWEDRVPKAAFDVVVDHVVELLTPYLAPHATVFSPEGTPLFDSISTEEAVTYLNPDGVNGYPLDKVYPDKRAAVQAYAQGKVDLDAMTERIYAGDPVLFAAGGKIEVRDISKIHLDKLRSFMIAPIQLIIAGIRCTHKFQQAVNAGGARSIITAGMSGCHGQWKHFLEANDSPSRPCVADSDCPAWDGNLMLLVMCAMNRVVTRFLTPLAAEQFLRCWLADAASPVLMPDGTIAFRWGGNPSGSFLTTIGNSICNLVIFNLCLMENRRYSYGESWDVYLARREIYSFPLEVRYTVHGDDNLITSSERMYIYCNHRALNLACERLNLGTRFDNYSGERKSLVDAVYCSHTTVTVRGYLLPSLISVEKIIGSLVLGSAKSIPADQTRAYYELSRAWGFLLTVFPSQRTWKILYQCIWELQALYLDRFPRDKTITKALSNLKCYDAALRHWALPLVSQSRLPQRLADVSAAEMSTNETKQVARHAAKKELNKDLNKALNPATHRGFRNKGKVATMEHKLSQNRPSKHSSRKNPGSTIRQNERSGTAAVGRSVDYRPMRSSKQIATSGLFKNTFLPVTCATTGGFAVISTQLLNPSNSTLFPRVQSLASLYEKWRFKHLSVTYRAMCPSTTGGMFGMYVDKDATDQAESNMTSLGQNTLSVNGSVWTSKVLRIRGSDIVGRWFYTGSANQISTSSVPNALDRQNSPGVLRLCLDYATAGTLLGYMEVTGEIEFCSAKPPPALVANVEKFGSWVSVGDAPILYDPNVDAIHLHGMELLPANAGPDTTFPSNLPGFLYINNRVSSGFFMFVRSQVNNNATLQLRQVTPAGALSVVATFTFAGGVASTEYQEFNPIPSCRYFLSWVGGADTITVFRWGIARETPTDQYGSRPPLIEQDLTSPAQSIAGLADSKEIQDFIVAQGSRQIAITVPAVYSARVTDIDELRSEIDAIRRLLPPESPRSYITVSQDTDTVLQRSVSVRPPVQRR